MFLDMTGATSILNFQLVPHMSFQETGLQNTSTEWHRKTDSAIIYDLKTMNRASPNPIELSITLI